MRNPISCYSSHAYLRCSVLWKLQKIIIKTSLPLSVLAFRKFPLGYRLWRHTKEEAAKGRVRDLSQFFLCSYTFDDLCLHKNLSKSAGIDLRHLQKTPYNRRSWCPFRGDWVWNSHTLHSCIEKKTIMFSSLNIICCNVLMYKPAGTKTVYQCRKHWKELQGWVSAVQVIPKDLWGSSNPHKPILCKQPTNQP